ncbi:hypothetical protein ACTZFK_26175, partial [Escherichia coli]|uniref:hypothetical protein n=1 Tax=Escherichia coli TaxID=562 RepID=UPI004067A111
IMTPAVEAVNSDAVCMVACLAPCDETLRRPTQKRLRITPVVTVVVDAVVEVAVAVDPRVPHRGIGHARA